MPFPTSDVFYERMFHDILIGLVARGEGEPYGAVLYLAAADIADEAYKEHLKQLDKAAHHGTHD